MPQLDPSPWFLILTTAWLTLLIIVLPVVLSRTSPNPPTPQSTQAPEMTPWHWKWA